MTFGEIALSFGEIVETDIPELTAVMTRAFDDDAHKHLGQERGGPDGYDTGDFFRNWLFGHEESVGYKVLVDGKIAGGIIVWILAGRENILGTIFVDPEFQDHGIGARLWEFVEQRHPDTASWRLGTPEWATKNHHFYAKRGFTRVAQDPANPASDDSVTFRKSIGDESCDAPD